MPRSRDVTASQQRLSAATWAVLATDGLTGLTMRAVAERAGCTTGLVMHTFPDKRALLLHARTLLHERSAERFDAVEAAIADPEQRLRRVLSQAASVGAGADEFSRVWLAYAAAAVGDPELADRPRTHNRAFLARVERLLAAARPPLARAARREAAVALVALVEGLNILAALDPDTYPADRQRRAIDDAVARQLG
jgi:AcrR family transcriptional regulator